MSEGYCEICDCKIEVQICCSGFECGCMGQPIEPPICVTCAVVFGEKIYCSDEDRNGKTYQEVINICRDALYS